MPPNDELLQQMKPGLFFISGLLLTVLIIPWVRKLSLEMGYVDRPEGDSLKIHPFPIPHSGGIALFSVFGLLVIFLFFAGDVVGVEVLGLLLGGSMAFGLGVWGDLKPISPVVRLCGGVLVGIVLMILDHSIAGPLFISLPVTLFFVVGAINAMNMEDGLDGLAGGMACMTCLGFAVLSAKTGQGMSLLISVVLCGAIVGFLCYNFDPASIFMGDNGSYFVGFIVAYLAIGFTDLNQCSTLLGPILILGVPIFDTAYAIFRRLKNGVSPFIGDRKHLYDRLMQQGLSVRETVLVFWGIQATLVGLGVAIF